MASSARNALSGSSRAASLRRLTVFSPAKAQVQNVPQPLAGHGLPPPIPADPQISRHAGPPGLTELPRTYFDGTGVLWVGVKGEQPPDPNKTKLGKTLRVLQERLPTLLQYPLPQEILAPNINLHLFPSTHPHLPNVSGRVAYSAALWTSPIAWNRVPIVGNVRLEILAERMTSEPLTFLPRRPGAMPEQLVVRWCEKRRLVNDGTSEGVTVEGKRDAAVVEEREKHKEDSFGSGIARSLRFGRSKGVDPKKAFTGLFIFDFDQEGRILTHTIEQTQAGGNWERGVGAKFVGLTDWLLGGIKEPGNTPLPAFEKLDRRRRSD